MGSLVVALGVATVLSSVTLPKVGGGSHVLSGVLLKHSLCCEIMSVFDCSCGLVRFTDAHCGGTGCVAHWQASATKYLPR